MSGRRLMLVVASLAGSWVGFANGAWQASARFQFQDQSKQLTLSASGGRARQVDAGWNIQLRGKVTASDRGRGMDLAADTLVADIAGTSKNSELRHAIATGKVHLVKTVQNAQGRQVTEIDSTRADYRLESTQAVVDLSGPVQIRNSNPQKRETLLASGRQGRAYLDPGTKTEGPNSLRRAELTGGVRVRVNQARGNSRLIATGGKMVIEQSKATRRITMTENVSIDGEGSARMFSASGQRKVVMVLNMAGDVVEWAVENR